MSGYFRLGYVMSSDFWLYKNILGYVRLGYVMSGYLRLGPVRSG